MSDQVQDTFIYQGSEHMVIGIGGAGLLSPRDFGMSPVGISTDCVRGYYSEYSLMDGKLILAALTVTLDPEDEYKDIGDIHPVGDPNCFIVNKYYGYRYYGLNITPSFTGGFLIGKGLIGRAFTSPLAYEVVVELLFADGNLTKAIDHSEVVTKTRNDLLQRKPGCSSEIEFSLEYDFMYNWHKQK